jgi:hypothetical protein
MHLVRDRYWFHEIDVLVLRTCNGTWDSGRNDTTCGIGNYVTGSDFLSPLWMWQYFAMPLTIERYFA